MPGPPARANSLPPQRSSGHGIGTEPVAEADQRGFGEEPWYNLPMRRPRFQFRLPSLTQNVGPRTTFVAGVVVGVAAWMACSWGDQDFSWWPTIPMALFGGLLLWIADKFHQRLDL